MEGLQGAILRVKLRYLEEWTAKRRAHAILYNELLSDKCVVVPAEMPYAKHVYHIYALCTHLRDALMKNLNENNIYTGIHYPYPVHLMKAYADLGYKKGDFPISERIAMEELSLPIYPELTPEQVEEICHVINTFKSV